MEENHLFSPSFMSAIAFFSVVQDRNKKKKISRFQQLVCARQVYAADSTFSFSIFAGFSHFFSLFLFCRFRGSSNWKTRRGRKARKNKGILYTFIFTVTFAVETMSQKCYCRNLRLR